MRGRGGEALRGEYLGRLSRGGHRRPGRRKQGGANRPSRSTGSGTFACARGGQVGIVVHPAHEDLVAERQQGGAHEHAEDPGRRQAAERLNRLRLDLLPTISAAEAGFVMPEGCEPWTDKTRWRDRDRSKGTGRSAA